MIKVCDAIMGSGKSSAAITYINEHPKERFIYITPYLDEAARIREACPNAHFVEPSDKLPEYGFRKVRHTEALIAGQCNISTTHAAFHNYSAKMLDDIRVVGYTLIIDENTNMLGETKIQKDDLQLAIDSGYIVNVNETYKRTDKPYTGSCLRDLLTLAGSRNFVAINNKSGKAYYWELPSELISSFRNVFILTYLFNAQSLHHMLEIGHLPYTYIGVRRCDDGLYRFTDIPCEPPAYTKELPNKIHILEHEKMNAVGGNRCALSQAWFQRGGDDVEKLRKHLYNYFRGINKDVSKDRFLWGTFKDAFWLLRGKGYTKAFLPFNARATNEYRDRDYLAYPINVFMHVGEKSFYRSHGVEIDEDAYALSFMVQWIWRSAIRDGKEIHIYIPSKRMRTILQNWIASFGEGVDE